MASDDAIQAQLARANDFSTPLHERAPVSEAVKGQVKLRDNPTLQKGAKAEIVKEGEDKTPLRAPPGAAITSRNSVVQVIREEPDMDGRVRPDAIDTIEYVGGEGKSATPSESVVYADRPGDSDGVVGVVADISERVAEDPEVESQYYDGEIEEKPIEVPPEPPPQAPPEPVVAAHTAAPEQPTAPVVTRVAPANSDAAPKAPPAKRRRPMKKQRVTISNDDMGRIQAKVDLVSISDTLVVLGFIDDDETVIIEPPAKGAESVVRITYEEKYYDCHYFGFTTTLPLHMDSRKVPIFLVVLVRKSE